LSESNAIRKTVSEEIVLRSMDESWESFRRKYKPEKDENYSIEVSKDVGLLDTSFSDKSTYLSFLLKPSMKELEEIGYITNASKITPFSEEGLKKDGYSDPRGIGSATHDIRDDIAGALEAAKGTEIGWAGHPSDM
jgi:hypothetical protein